MKFEDAQILYGRQSWWMHENQVGTHWIFQVREKKARKVKTRKLKAQK